MMNLMWVSESCPRASCSMEAVEMFSSCRHSLAMVRISSTFPTSRPSLPSSAPGGASRARGSSLRRGPQPVGPPIHVRQEDPEDDPHAVHHVRVDDEVRHPLAQ